MENSVRGARPGKQVDMSEAEIKMLCVRSREILINQPMLLGTSCRLKIFKCIFGLILTPSSRRT